MLKVPLLLVAVTFATSATLCADGLIVSVSGQFSSSDVASSFVAPNGVFTIEFGVDSNPTPIAGSVTSLGFDIPSAGFYYALNGVQVNPVPVTEIRFNTLANGGLFDVTIGSGLAATEFDFQGVQLFTGMPAAPAIALGKYDISSWTVSDPNNFDTQTPASSLVAVTTPEPSSLLLFTVAAIFTIVVFRRTLAHFVL